MTTLTQSDLDDLRRRALTDCMSISNENTVALLDHIAQLTAELDEAIARGGKAEADCGYWAIDCDKLQQLLNATNKVLASRETRIAELEAQSSAQFVAGMQRALHKLSNEVLGCASTFEPELRQYLGHTNFNILVARAEIARAILAEAALKGEGK